MERRDLWIDFNDVGPDSRGFSSLGFAEAYANIDVGNPVVVGDDEGNLCDAQVLGIEENGVVTLVVDIGTFRSGTPASSSSRISA
jgi:hypothetical protein